MCIMYNLQDFEVAMIKTYVINLKTSIKRKQYVDDLLSSYSDFLDVDFIEAVDGRNLSSSQLGKIWNQDDTYKTYGRFMKGGEIGCALSHRKCCETILKNGEDVALILEDDVAFLHPDISDVILSTAEILRTERPAVALLFGEYWYTIKKMKLDSRFSLVNVHDAIMTTAYMINRRAAEHLMNAPLKYLADDWYNLKRGRFTLYAVKPHIADTALFETEISGDGYSGTVRSNLSLPCLMNSYYRAMVRRLWGQIGHFEKRG